MVSKSVQWNWKPPVIAVLGDHEVEEKTLSVRSRQAGGDLGVFPFEELLEKMQKAIAEKSLF